LVSDIYWVSLVLFHVSNICVSNAHVSNTHTRTGAASSGELQKSTGSRAENARGEDKQPERAARRAIALFFQNSYSESCKSLIILKCSAYSLGSENCFFLA
jgi:hypothetical protein